LVRTLRQQALTVSGTRGISQVELAKRIGLSQPRISQIEKGEGRDGLTYTVIRKIAHACGVNWRLVIQHALESVAQSDVDMPVKREAQPLSLAGDVHLGCPVPTVDVFSFGDRSPLQAYRATRKDGATGVDGATAADYAERLHAIAGLLQHLRQAQPPQNIPGYNAVLSWRPHNAPAVAAESAPVRNGQAPRDPPAEPPRVSVRQTAGDEVDLDIPAFLRRQAS
jgi:transcriptional regulator with XRE-family HTH domain